MLYPGHPGDTPAPSSLQEMIAISRSLASGFPFIRVDLYDFNGNVYFGEMTFHPEGGFGPIIPDGWDYKIGEWLKLPEV